MLRNDETWPFLLERELRQRGLGGAEVLNGGYAGWGMEQAVLALEHRYLPVLKADLVRKAAHPERIIPGIRNRK